MGRTHHKFTGSKGNCKPCELRAQCLRTPEKTLVRQVAIFDKNQPSPHQATEAMKRAIDSETRATRLQPAHRHRGASICQSTATRNS